MAEIFPFSALRYHAAGVALASVVAQPYDKITPAMQERYYAASPYNLVRIILGKPEAGDGAARNVYTRAAGYLQEWRAQGILWKDSQPSLYAYEQEFELPGGPRRHRRRGFIALGRICDYSERIVFRHEQTLSAPKADRLNLLRATRAHCGQIFMLYSDPAAEIESCIFANRSADGPAAQAEIEDEYGVVHRLSPIAEPEVIARVQTFMRAKQLIIADGHHRYETALNYRDERRQQDGVSNPLHCAAYEKVMMTFINMESPGLVVLPTHRVVSGADAELVASLPAAARAFFKVQELSAGTLNRALDQLKSAGENGVAVLLCTRERFHLLRGLPEKLGAFMRDLSPRQQQLDVAVLHRALLGNLLGISEAAVQHEQNISYFRDAAEAVAQVRGSASQVPRAQLAFLLNPVPIAQLREVALAGELMPQKSTDFYPKLLSGLAIYALD